MWQYISKRMTCYGLFPCRKGTQSRSASTHSLLLLEFFSACCWERVYERCGPGGGGLRRLANHVKVLLLQSIIKKSHKCWHLILKKVTFEFCFFTCSTYDTICGKRMDECTPCLNFDKPLHNHEHDWKQKVHPNYFAKYKVTKLTHVWYTIVVIITSGIKTGMHCNLPTLYWI